jgi:DNA-binding response OmpR family regulator
VWFHHTGVFCARSTVRVLIVEDDFQMRELLERGLREEQFHVDVASEGLAAEERATTEAFDAVVLDVILPGQDGIAVCRRLRMRGVDTPILMLTGRNQVDDRVRGLNAGADDYLAKPFALGELVARLRALTRRGRTRTLQTLLSCGPIVFDQRDRSTTVHGTPIVLSVTEQRLLEYLLHRSGRLVTREDLAQHVWGHELGPESKVIEVYISYLRRKLGPEGALLRTVRGRGYTLSAGRS